MDRGWANTHGVMLKFDGGALTWRGMTQDEEFGSRNTWWE